MLISLTYINIKQTHNNHHTTELTKSTNRPIQPVYLFSLFVPQIFVPHFTPRSANFTPFHSAKTFRVLPLANFPHSAIRIPHFTPTLGHLHFSNRLTNSAQNGTFTCNQHYSTHSSLCLYINSKNIHLPLDVQTRMNLRRSKITLK